MNITVKIHNGHPIVVNEHGTFFVEETDEHEAYSATTLSAVVAWIDNRNKARAVRPPRAERKAGFYIEYDREVKPVTVTSIYKDTTWRRADWMCRFTMRRKDGGTERKNENAKEVYLDSPENREILTAITANIALRSKLMKDCFELKAKLATFDAAAKEEEAAEEKKDDGPALRIV